MKSIFRSPIEPEFAYLVRSTIRRYRVLAVSRLQSFGTRVKVLLREQWTRLSHWAKNTQKNAQKYFEERRGALTAIVPPQNEASTAKSAFLEKSASFQASFSGFIRGLSWPKLDNSSRSFLLGLFLISLIAGAGFKTLARESVTIGFEDYKLASPDTLVDLNEVQKRVLEEGGSLALENKLVGEQCVEQ